MKFATHRPPSVAVMSGLGDPHRVATVLRGLLWAAVPVQTALADRGGIAWEPVAALGALAALACWVTCLALPGRQHRPVLAGGIVLGCGLLIGAAAGQPIAAPLHALPLLLLPAIALLRDRLALATAVIGFALLDCAPLLREDPALLVLCRGAVLAIAAVVRLATLLPNAIAAARGRRIRVLPPPRPIAWTAPAHGRPIAAKRLLLQIALGLPNEPRAGYACAAGPARLLLVRIAVR